MKVQIRMFAGARQLCGDDILELELEQPPTVAQLRSALACICPALSPLLPHVRIAVNMRYVTDDTQILPTDEVACIPPVSGG